MTKCIICEKEEPAYPVADFATGFYFCDKCWHEAGDAFDKYKEKTLGNWLRAIADVRDKHTKMKPMKEPILRAKGTSQTFEPIP